MPIWRPLPVEFEPVIPMVCWQIIRLPEGDRHLLGRHANGLEIRVSSRLVGFERATMKVRTRSGRIYLLRGASGFSGDDEYVLLGWCRVNRTERETIEFVDLDALADLPGLESGQDF